jgi:hypothetical protein
MFVIELLAVCSAGIAAFMLLFSGASSRELGSSARPKRGTHAPPRRHGR